jgi:hypothetical protein
LIDTERGVVQSVGDNPALVLAARVVADSGIGEAGEADEVPPAVGTPIGMLRRTEESLRPMLSVKLGPS